MTGFLVSSNFIYTQYKQVKFDITSKLTFVQQSKKKNLSETPVSKNLKILQHFF